MRRNPVYSFVGLSLALVVGCSSKAQDAQSQKDRAALQGEWEVVSAESNGEPPPAGRLIGTTMSFSGEQSRFLGKDGTFDIDARSNPRQIEFNRGRIKQIGIYELDGDRLTVCVGPSDDRPIVFKTKPRTDHTLLVLKRRRSGSENPK